jgi:Spy/CpxP family protein refolding chaperone
MEPSKPNPTEQGPATNGWRHSSFAVLARPMLFIFQHYYVMNWTVFLMAAVPLTTFSPLLSQLPEFFRSPTREVTRDYDTRVWNELSLTDVQREQIDQITVSNEQSTKAILRNVLTAKLALRDAIIKNPSGEGPIRSLSTGLGYAMTELTVQQARIYSEIVQVLTPAQQQQLSQFAKKRETSLQDSIELLSQSGS